MDASAWDERYAASDRVWSRGPNVFVERELSDLPPGRALDLAGGEGRHAVWLARRGWDVELVEFSRVALDKAAAAAAAAGVGIVCTHADVTARPDLDPADLVLIAYLQVPRDAAARAVGHAAGLVGPGGTFLLVAHARRNLTEGVGGPDDPDVLPTVEEVCADLADSGLTITRASEVARPVDTDDGTRQAIDLLVRAQRPRSPDPEVGT